MYRDITAQHFQVIDNSCLRKKPDELANGFSVLIDVGTAKHLLLMNEKEFANCCDIIRKSFGYTIHGRFNSATYWDSFQFFAAFRFAEGNGIIGRNNARQELEQWLLLKPAVLKTEPAVHIIAVYSYVPSPVPINIDQHSTIRTRKLAIVIGPLPVVVHRMMFYSSIPAELLHSVPAKNPIMALQLIYERVRNYCQDYNLGKLSIYGPGTCDAYCLPKDFPYAALKNICDDVVTQVVAPLAAPAAKSPVPTTESSVPTAESSVPTTDSSEASSAETQVVFERIDLDDFSDDDIEKSKEKSKEKSAKTPTKTKKRSADKIQSGQRRSRKLIIVSESDEEPTESLKDKAQSDELAKSQSDELAKSQSDELVVEKPKRGPGRPRKVVVDEVVIIEKPTGLTAVENPTTKPKRGPGRPRKSPANTSPASIGPITKPKRGPGRPRKVRRSVAP